jgi:hypothetical protein
MGFLAQLGGSILGTEVQSISDTATEAYLVLVAIEFFIFIGITLLVLQGFHIL